MNELRKIREIMNISQTEMAFLLETSPKTFQGWEQGRPIPVRMKKSIRLLFWFYRQGKLELYKKI